jgi:ribosomal protein L32
MSKPRREQARHEDSGVVKWASLTVCPACGKKTYPNKKAAKLAAKNLYPDDHLSAYRCRSTKDVRPTPAPWHVGHLDERIMTGQMDRRDAYDPKQYQSRPDVVNAINRIAKATVKQEFQ